MQRSPASWLVAAFAVAIAAGVGLMASTAGAVIGGLLAPGDRTA